MSGIIGWIIIIWIIVVSAKSSQKKGAENKTVSPSKVPAEKSSGKTRIEETVKRGYQMVTEQAQKYASASGQEELKRRLMEKYTSGYPQKKPDILERASANVAKDFEENTAAQPEIEKDSSDNVYSFSEEIETSQIKNVENIMENVSQSGLQEVLQAVTQNQIREEAKVLSQVNLHTIYDIPQMQQESELMKMVSDILAKGMNTEPAFSRDFVAEGLDMINKTL